MNDYLPKDATFKEKYLSYSKRMKSEYLYYNRDHTAS